MDMYVNTKTNKDILSFTILGHSIRFLIYSGDMYLVFRDITEGLEIDYQTYRDKLDANVSKKYPTVSFSNQKELFITIGTLMRLLADLESAGGHFKTNTSARGKIHQYYLAFK